MKTMTSSPILTGVIAEQTEELESAEEKAVDPVSAVINAALWLREQVDFKKIASLSLSFLEGWPESPVESAAEKLREREQQREFEKAANEGKIVPVSAHVARLMEKAQAQEKAEQLRIERRKAARAARRKNR